MGEDEWRWLLNVVALMMSIWWCGTLSTGREAADYVTNEAGRPVPAASTSAGKRRITTTERSRSVKRF